VDLIGTATAARLEQVRTDLEHRVRRQIDVGPPLLRAGVLIPVFLRQDRAEILFTRRTDTVLTHKGQISFPGGQHETTDASLVQTALRETYEEIGLSPSRVSVPGELDDVFTAVSRFVITPIVGQVAGGIDDLTLAPDEVRSIFTVPVDRLRVPSALRADRFDASATGGRFFFEDYAPGERIYHADGMTVEESEHALATRLYQNLARVHFNGHQMQDSRFGRRLMYGGHVISIARALSFNGLENALGMLAWNAGSHVNPTFAGDTLYAWSDVLETADLPREPSLGALRLRLNAVKNVDPRAESFEARQRDEGSGRERYNPAVVLDLDYWLLMPRRSAAA